MAAGRRGSSDSRRRNRTQEEQRVGWEGPTGQGAAGMGLKLRIAEAKSGNVCAMARRGHHTLALERPYRTLMFYVAEVVLGGTALLE